jgi:hypothetical protein
MMNAEWGMGIRTAGSWQLGGGTKRRTKNNHGGLLSAVIGRPRGPSAGMETGWQQAAGGQTQHLEMRVLCDAGLIEAGKSTQGKDVHRRRALLG